MKKGDTPPPQVSPTSRNEVSITHSTITDNGHLTTGHLGHLDEHLEHLFTRKRAAHRPRIEWTATMTANLNHLLGACDESGSFPCPIPKHTGNAILVDGERGDPVLQCCKGPTRPLGEVRAAAGYGFDRKLFNKEILVWTRRLAWELGGFEPVPVAVPAPEGPPHIRTAAEYFALLCGLRWRDWKEEAVAFSIKFAAAWCGLTFRQANEAIHVLEDQGVIQKVGERQMAAHLRPLREWMPGPVKESGEVLTMPEREWWL